MKIRIASALTKPVTTERDTKRISTPRPDPAGEDLQHAGEDGRREQVFEAVLLDQGDHQQRHGAGCGRDHARATTREGDDHRDAEGGIEADLGIDASDDREGDRLRNQCQRDDEAGEQIVTDVGEPVLLEGFHLSL